MIFIVFLALLFGPSAEASAPIVDKTHAIQEEPVLQELSIPHPNCEKYVDDVLAHDWDPELALKVMYKESGCSESAHNPEAHKNRAGEVICYGSFSLFQVGCVHGAYKDASANIAKASEIYEDREWAAWGVCDFTRSCSKLRNNTSESQYTILVPLHER